jgi:ribose transport system permease protein
MERGTDKNSLRELRELVNACFSHAGPVVVIYAVFLVLLVLLGIISPFFSSTTAVANLLSSALPLAFAALAQTVVVLLKGIDLSVGPAMSLVMVVAASIAKDSPASMAVTLVLCLAIGLAIGAVNGFFVVFARLQPIIVTLATSSVLSGIALYIMPQPGGYIPRAVGSIATGSVGAVPVSFIVLIVSLLILWMPFRRSRIGQSCYAIGGNETGAFYSGINVRLAKFSGFLLGGLFSALGGIALASQTLTGDAMIGAPYTLNSVAALVLGGTSLAGGRGGAIGAIGGVLVLTIMVDILFFLNVSAYFQYVFSGAIIILALFAVSLSDVFRSHRLRIAKSVDRS